MFNKSAETVQQDKQHVALVVAMTRNRLIGSEANSGLPWHLPDELQLFKRITYGGSVLMGRKTHALIGRPLPGRNNIVISRSQTALPGVKICDSLSAGLCFAAKLGEPVFVIGGAELYLQALPIATELHISWIKAEAAGDVYFPQFDLADWIVSEENEFTAFHYVHYLRKSQQAR